MGYTDRPQLDGRCHPPRMTLMNFRAHDFMGSCSPCDQVLKAAPSTHFQEPGGWVACLRLHSRLMAELGVTHATLSAHQGLLEAVQRHLLLPCGTSLTQKPGN